MKTKLLLLFLIVSINSFAQNNVCFTIEANPNINDPALSIFTKYVNVFSCSIYAESNVSDEKTLHAAAILAELLDNDEDGIVDDPLLLQELVNREMLMPIFNFDGSPGMDVFFDNYNGDGACAVLWATEIDPAQPGHWGSDATIEEILHTINCVGHVNLYPDAFSLAPNSSLLTNAMDLARGGQFLNVPNSYPAEAWYHYDDFTCDYECMAIEYLYWCIVSWMGILDDPATCSGIANEWEPCSPTLLQSMDAAMFNLITDPTYKLPQLAPDGNYCPTLTSTTKLVITYPVKLFPNPVVDILFIENDNQLETEIQIRNILGQIISTAFISKEHQQINLSHLSAGVYLLTYSNLTIKIIKQ